MKPLRVIDAFSGIGGFALAGERLGGFKTICFIEKEPYCQKILKKHWADIPIHDDIRTFQPEMGSADVICGGFPCQDISVAGKQAGIQQDTRSGLFFELMRIIRVVRPRFIVLENVSAILGNGLDTVLGQLSEAGFDAEWACIPASAVGACHRRDRWWLVAYTNSLGSKSEQISGMPKESRFNNRSIRENAPDPVFERPQGFSQRISAVRGVNPRRNTQLGDGCRTRNKQWAKWESREITLNPNWRTYVSQPVLCRGDDGLSNRVDRLKALGNAVVPAVAEIPLARVLQLANETSNAPLPFKQVASGHGS